jgi:DNA-binding PadR family transcriptional regulator
VVAIKRKSYTTSEQIADELIQVAEEMGVPESSIVNFALKQFLWNYRQQERQAEIPENLRQLTTA